MEFDFMPSTLYLKLSKSVAQTIWKMQQIDQKSVIDAADPAPVVIHSIIRSLQLDLTSFNSEGNICEAIQWTKKKLDKLSDVVQKTRTPFSDIITLARGLFSLYMAEVPCVFEAIQNVETAARNLAHKWKEHSNIFVHLVRSLKFALLRDDLAMRNECGLLLQVFDRLSTHNCKTLSSMYTTALLWSALRLETELQLLVLIAQRISLSYPGGKFIVERFGKQSAENTSRSDATFNFTWNPFTVILKNFNANNRIEQSTAYFIEAPPVVNQESYLVQAKEPSLSPLNFTFDEIHDSDIISHEYYAEDYYLA
eukprot:TRINITY_DN6126_c0_g1_i1.p1 TRINITY_DN6126_c0_g1~~TRINITY_DN6126_c0_g1_i1.p1  ORF type:complete len:323 (+),score=27.92 TRINITY_DN6126_c0_g1_i1:40-969(+)